nr:putative ribonuclease H-like domain-containing protein [Tanacetum cinerariifolium]
WSRHVTIVHQTKDLHTADYTQLYDFLKYNQKEVDELKAKRLAKIQDPLALMENSNNPYRISSNPCNRQIAQPGMNMGQDRQMQMVGGNGENQFRQYAGQNNGLIGVLGDGNLNGNGNLVAAHAEGNAAGHNGNQIRCYNCRGVGYFSRNCTVMPRRRDAAYLQTHLLIAQKEKEVAGIQLQNEEFDLMAAAVDLDEIEEVNANYILMANLQQALTSGTQTDKAPVYDSDGSAEVHDYENCDDNVIFNMFTQEEQYTKLLEPIPEPHQVPQNDNSIISEITSVEQSGETVEHPANFVETRALYDSLYHNLAIEVEKVNTVNRKLKETNADMTTELARFKNQEKINALHLSSGKQIMTLNEEILDLNKQLSKEKSYISFLLEEKKRLKSDFKIREDELLDKQIQLEKKIKELNNILVKTGQSIQTIHMFSPNPDSFYHTKQKMALGYQNPFYLKQAHRKQQSLYDDKVLLEKHDPPVVHDLEKTLQLAQESREKMKHLNKEIKPTNYTKINHLLRVFVSQTAKLREELYFSNDSKMANVSKPISKPNEEFSDDTTPIVARMFRINPFKTSREEKHVPNIIRASAGTKPITVSQPPVITKKDVNSDSNGFSSTGKDNTKTRRPQPRSNTKNDRVPSASKSGQSKNKDAKVEEHHRNLLLSKNKKHMSSACNNIKLVSQNVISKVVCAMCKQCLVSVNHDVCLRNYVNGKNYRGKKQTANDSIKEKQKKHQPKVKKLKKVGFIERLATPKPRKPRVLLRWSPTGRLFDQKGKIVDSTESESQSDCSNDDNACCSKHMTRNLKLLINFIWKFMGTVRFGNDHVAAILGFGDLQWGNILITRVYFVEGLGHNLFSVGQFCDSDLEVAFRRNACFVRNLEGVDLLKGDRSKNLYTINLYKMSSASPIYLMARAFSTKSWLWHQQHLCPSCEQGKSKRASHPPKPVPNSRQRLHLLHMDLCGPMRIASINGKQYVLVIVDDYSRYMWVHFLRSKDEAPEVIKTFLKRITVLLQFPVIIIRIDNGTEFKNHVLKEYFDSVGISH